MIRILIADDHGMVRQGLDQLLKTAADMSVIAYATNGVEAVYLCEQWQPDVVLMDLMMPEMDGLTATRLIRQLLPNIKVVVLSARTDPEKLQAVTRVGAHAFLSKSGSIEQILETVRTVYGDG